MKCTWKLSVLSLQLFCKSKFSSKEKEKTLYFTGITQVHVENENFSNFRDMKIIVLEQVPGICILTGTQGDSDAYFSGIILGETLI